METPSEQSMYDMCVDANLCANLLGSYLDQKQLLPALSGLIFRRN